MYVFSFCLPTRKNVFAVLHAQLGDGLGAIDNAYDRDNAYADVDSEAIGQRLYFGMFTLQMLTK